MIANINPSNITFEDSHNTLKYANRAKNIKVNPLINDQLKESTWVEREARLRDENAFLRNRVLELEEVILSLRPEYSLEDGGVKMNNFLDESFDHQNMSIDFIEMDSSSSSSSSSSVAVTLAPADASTPIHPMEAMPMRLSGSTTTHAPPAKDTSITTASSSTNSSSSANSSSSSSTNSIPGKEVLLAEEIKRIVDSAK